MAKQPVKQAANKPTSNKAATSALIRNELFTLRQDMINRLLNPTRDLNYACGYPDTISMSDYQALYDRLGLAKRVVGIWPEECWKVEPKIYETEKSDETKFEKQMKELQRDQHLFHYLERIDHISGIGQYGVLFLGFADGEDIGKPVQGLNEETGEKSGTKSENKLLYVRPFGESSIEIKTNQTDKTNPRYGYPIMYTITFAEGTGTTLKESKVDVHWTRLIHVADNRETSEVLGTPRMKCVYNHLLDMKKVSGGSAEMFWKGGFPGYNYKVDPALDDVDLDIDTLKEQIRLYSEGLQRYTAMIGVDVQSLEPQVADPRGQFETMVKLIAISLGVPWRLLLGTEEAKLASSQDKTTWNERLAKRQNSYCSPMLIRPMIDRLIATGVLVEPAEYFIDWPDLNAPTDQDIAEIALKRTEAYAKYVGGNVAAVIPPKEYHMMIHGMTEEEADALEKAAGELELTLEPEQPEQKPKPGSEEE